MRRLVLIAAISLVASSVNAQQKVDRIGNWDVTNIVDPVTDKSRTIASAKGEGGLFAIKCDEAGVDSVYLHFISSKYLGASVGRYASRTRDLIYRFDEDAPATGSWIVDKSAALELDANKVRAFAGRLSNAKRLVVRTTTYEFADVTAVFDVTGAADAVKAVMAGCKNSPASPAS